MKMPFQVLFLVSVMLASCIKNNADNAGLSNTPINFTAPLNDPRLSRLNSPGGGVIIPGYGRAGLLLYRTLDGTSLLAYDAASTVNPDKRRAVVIDGSLAIDTESGAKYLLEDGSPVKAPATVSLTRYPGVTVTQFQISVVN